MKNVASQSLYRKRMENSEEAKDEIKLEKENHTQYFKKHYCKRILLAIRID
jgi:hypothetical protein